MNSKLNFVIPWYGENIAGGAESLCRSVVHALRKAGVAVEVLTTCVKEFRSDWSQNYHPEGTTVEGGVTVRRFRVRNRDSALFDAVNQKLMRNQPVTPEEEHTFITEMINSPGLYEYISQQSSESVFLFIPYMFGTTYWGSLRCPDRSILIPCLHNESYARMQVFRKMFEGARGLLFNSKAEMLLAEELFTLDSTRLKVVGAPIDCGLSSVPRRFRQKHGVSDYFLYAGRTDKGKGAELLVDYFCRYLDDTQRHEQLVVIGGGELEIPRRFRSRVLKLGYVPVQTKYDAYGGAIALCVPSTMESFSIVTMESWISGRPVIVNAHCDVTRDFCMESNGGLYFADYPEFRETLLTLARDPKLCTALGANGRQYALGNFHPDAIARKYLRALESWGFC